MKKLFDILNENIENHKEIVLMTHARPDLDGMGSAICLYNIIKSLNKKCFIIAPKEKKNHSLNKALKLLNDIDFKSYDELSLSNPLLIILDTQKPELVEDEKVLEIKDKIVIDHHISSSDTINDVIYKYDDVNKSSIAEIMAEYVSYLKVSVPNIMMTILLAGMVIDTSNFCIKTTYKTFEMASFLAKNGADFVVMSEILKEPQEDMMERYDFIRNSKEIEKNILMCKMDDKIHNNVEIALLAKELLKFEDIRASFAIGHLSKRIIGVSARSMGSINVGKIMEKIGGGGHLTDAGAQIKDKSVSEVALMIKKALKEEICE